MDLSRSDLYYLMFYLTKIVLEMKDNCCFDGACLLVNGSPSVAGISMRCNINESTRER
jgi:hypothetical protein